MHPTKNSGQHEQLKLAHPDGFKNARRSKSDAEISHLDLTISAYEQALEFFSLESDLPSDGLDDWIEALLKHHQATGNLSSLDEALCLYKVTLSQRPIGHPLRTRTLEGYASLHTTIVKLISSEGSRNCVMAHHQELLRVLPKGDRRRDSCLNYLAISLFIQHSSSGGLEVLDEAIRLHRLALELRDDNHPFRETSLNGLAVALNARFRQQKDASTLNEIIELHTEALHLRSPDHPLRDVTLYNLGGALAVKFAEEGLREDLEKSISYQLTALELRPPGHPFRSLALMGVGNQYQRSFDHYGDSSHLAKALDSFREALELNPPGVHGRDGHLNNLALCLKTHFETYGDINKLRESVGLHREALTLRPVGHPYRSSTLHNLGESLAAEYEMHHAKESLLESIDSLRESLKLRPKGHPYRWNTLMYLGRVLLYHHRQCESEGALLEAIEHLRESLCVVSSALCQDLTSHMLAAVLSALYQHTRNSSYVAEATVIWENVLSFRKEGHPKRAETNFEFASMLFRTNPSDGWADAFEYLVQAVTDPFCPPRLRLHLAQNTLQVVESEAHSSQGHVHWGHRILDIYFHVIELLPQVAHLGLDSASRLEMLRGTEHLCRSAAARALILDRPEDAVEILEEGRNICWTQSLHLRSSDAFTDLPTDERSRLHELIDALNVPLPEASRANQADLDGIIELRRQQNGEIQRMLKRVRSRPGFDRFFKMESFARLIRGVSQGPVVILVSSDLGSYALIIVNDRGETRTVSLAHVTPKWLSQLRIRCIEAGFRNSGGVGMGWGSNSEAGGPISRLGIKPRRPVAGNFSTPTAVLEEIWGRVVWPVFESLGLKKQIGRDRPRLHWCPVGDFTSLPLHAAGRHTGQTKICTSDFVVSSYTPSLSALIKTRTGYTPISNKSMKTVVLAEANAVGFRPLPKVEAEVEAVAGKMKSASVECVVDLAPCVDTTIMALPSAHILHLACHGVQKEQALESHFALHDGPLTISMLAELNLPQAILAFLSACETAKGDEKQPDQTMHLAASLLFCGFRSVIGTMWAMHDNDGPVIAKVVYEELLGRGTLDLEDIPYALDTAIQTLRASGVSPTRWATFVHMGA